MLDRLYLRRPSLAMNDIFEHQAVLVNVSPAPTARQLQSFSVRLRPACRHRTFTDDAGAVY